MHSVFNPAPLGKPVVCHVRLVPSANALILASLALMGPACPVATAAEPQFEEVSTGLPAGNYAGLAMSDLDGDGRAELLAGRREKAEGLHLFTWRDSKWFLQEISTAGEYGGVALADVTGDKIPDVIAVKTKGNKGVELHQTVRRGGQLEFELLPQPFTGTSCDDLAVGDIDGDGDMDIAASSGGKGVQVLLNEGNGRDFRKLTLPTGTYEDTGIVLGDLNHDGRLDIIVGNHPGTPPRFFLCSASGEVTFSDACQDLLKVPSIGYRIAVADLDGDRRHDIAIGTSSGMRLFLGNGCQGDEAGWFRPLNLSGRTSQTMMVSIGDINRDGQPDLAFSSETGIHVLLNLGSGNFASRLQAGLPQKGKFAGCCLFDWDNDGDLDLACSSFHGETLRFFKNTLPSSSRR
jgi:hypothetical protein